MKEPLVKRAAPEKGAGEAGGAGSSFARAGGEARFPCAGHRHSSGRGLGDGENSS